MDDLEQEIVDTMFPPPANGALVETTAKPTSLATVLGVTPKQLMTYAIEVADTLTDVLRDRKMTRTFGAGEHVQTEGWQLAGSLLGFTAKEGPCSELPDGSYEAVMHLESSSGRTVATASARCGMDEPNWRSKPKYARRSMAYTRALGRVYAQNFRWLIKLAGYEGTPAEEMEESFVKATGEKPKSEPQNQTPAPEIYRAEAHQKQTLIDYARHYKLSVEKDDLRKLSDACLETPIDMLGKAVEQYAAKLKQQ